MNLIKKTLRIQLIVLIPIVIAACESMLDVDLPSDQLSVEAVFADSATVESAVNALYTENFYLNPVYYYLMPYYGAVMADESTHEIASLEVFNQNSYEASTSGVANVWTYAYQSIFLSNSLIERLEKTTAISQTRKKRFISEAKYFRAYSYFALVNFYGDVPLILGIAYKETMIRGREKTDVVYAKIISDLEEAWREIGDGNKSNTKVSKAAVAALLARVYLYTGKYAEAEEKAGELIADPAFELEEPDKVFLRSSKESILKMQDWRISYLGRTYWGGNVCQLANYNCLRDEFVNAFEENDLRKEAWIKQLGTRNYLQCVKYKQTRNPTNTELAEDQVMLRLAEQYLIRAEARAKQNKNDDAIDDLNAIRTRSSLPELEKTLTLPEILLAIEQERRVELFAEEAHRWWDLKRTARIDEVLGKIEDKKWKSYRALWPIPEVQLNANPNLTPNPGYGTIE